MSGSVQEQDEMRASSDIPPAIENLIQGFEEAKTPFTVRDVHQALAEVIQKLQNPTEAEHRGACAEFLAFALAGDRGDSSPWHSFFGPISSGTDKDGNPLYFPDIAGADANVIAHWANRAKSLNHPVLRARYADLVWEMAPLIAGGRRDPEMTRVAIEAYLASVPAAVSPDLYDRFEAALRALDLACLVRDQERKAAARDLLMQLHREAVETKKGLWWLAYDRLIKDKNAGTTDEQRQELVESIEEFFFNSATSLAPKNSIRTMWNMLQSY